jgi:hypothetical protein
MDLQEKMFSEINAWRESGLTKLGKVLEIEAPSCKNNRLCKSMFGFDEAIKGIVSLSLILTIFDRFFVKPALICYIYIGKPKSCRNNENKIFYKTHMLCITISMLAKCECSILYRKNTCS